MKSCYELFGIEVNKGWWHIIEPVIDLCEKEKVTILQIKEKFGTLRFYVANAPISVYEAIGKAEKLSEVTCEDCGAPGKLRTGSWLRTLCNACHKPRFSEGRPGGLFD